jgi:glucosamine--fructose-6-phosphate aminotransferase (isomerizing)
VDHARFRAATVLGLTNVLGSTLTRVARAYICQSSGPEIGVAATKTFTAQVIVLAMLALRLARLRGKLSQDEMDYVEGKLSEIPEAVEQILRKQEQKAKQFAKKYKDKQVFYFLGRGVSVATSLEARLKLSEIACVPSIAYPAGESKHGPISLIESGFPVIFICSQGATRKTLISNIMEMKARGATAVGVIEEGDKEMISHLDDYIEVPAGVPEVVSPIPFIVVLQLFAYYMAIERGLDPDKPRNLAKSVTVL